MTDTKHDPGDPEASAPAQSRALVEELVASFRTQVRNSLDFDLDDSAGTAALAFVDHYLSLLGDEDREPIISLVAKGAGAWFGELVRREIGGTWIGDGHDPRRLRLLLEPAFLHFSPIDLAYEAIFSGPCAEGDPRLPAGAVLDAAFHLRKRAPSPETEDGPPEMSEHDWVTERLAEAPPMAEKQFYSLTNRFETLELVLQLLAARSLNRGAEPTRYHLNDYVAALAGESTN